MRPDPETIIAQEVSWAKIGIVDDGEILGLDREGLVVFWCQETGSSYTNGMRPDDLDHLSLGLLERERLDRDGWCPVFNETRLAA